MITTIITQASPLCKKGQLIIVSENGLPKFIAVYGGNSGGADIYYPIHSYSHEMIRYRGIVKYRRSHKRNISLSIFTEVLEIQSEGSEGFIDQLHIVQDIDGVDACYAFSESMDKQDRVLITPVKMIGNYTESLVGSQITIPQSRCSPLSGVLSLSNLT